LFVSPYFHLLSVCSLSFPERLVLRPVLCTTDESKKWPIEIEDSGKIGGLYSLLSQQVRSKKIFFGSTVFRHPMQHRSFPARDVAFAARDAAPAMQEEANAAQEK
jgi:hypothetical protein